MSFTKDRAINTFIALVFGKKFERVKFCNFIFYLLLLSCVYSKTEISYSCPVVA